MRSGILGEEQNLVTMHDVMDAMWVNDNLKQEEYLRRSIMPLEVGPLGNHWAMPGLGLRAQWDLDGIHGVPFERNGISYDVFVSLKPSP